ncbi:MAG: motility associated factor glycosyltransferase family protein [Deltaproteobacteria bacterium]|nr:motility associated factor glycosyltransferase family protein [Deltaproteobacteria bacterium]
MNKMVCNPGGGTICAANRSVIEQRWPHIRKRMEEASGPKEVVFTRHTPQPTLFIDGIHLSSGYDQVCEAELQASLVPEESLHAWVYGVGPGQIPRVLLGRHRIKRVVVVIMNPGVAMQSFKYFDHSDWLSDSRVELVLGEYESDIHFPFAAVPSCLQLAAEPAARLRDLVFLELATPFIREKHSAENAELVHRLEENLKYVRSDGDAVKLFGSKKNSTIIVAAAGPTLSDHYRWIAEKQKNYPLIAVDAALRPLVNAGIYPDIIVSIDGNPAVASFFKEIDLSLFEGKPLVYFPIVHEDVLKLWPGKRLTAYPNHSLYKTLIKKHPRGILYSSGSVLHPCVDLAVKMGASKMVLLGADFSFPGRQSHVAGCPVHSEKNGGPMQHWVLNGIGMRVATSANMRGYLRDLEKYIDKHPRVRFINGSKDGAHIQGTTCLEDLSI